MDLVYWLMLIPLPVAVIVAVWKLVTRPPGETAGRTLGKLAVILFAGVLLVIILFFLFVVVYFTSSSNPYK